MPEAYLFKERRVYPRIDVKLPVSFWVLEDLEEIKSILDRRKREKQRPSLNVSLGGMCLLTGEVLQNGKILSLEISIPDIPTKLKAMADVVWSNESGGGIRFLTMNEDDLDALKTYLEKAASRQSDGQPE
jgi:c-di-GMP-binding flagellar brake protein YcgR